MSFLGSLLERLMGSFGTNDLGCDWYCDSCDTYMNGQLGFSTSSGVWTCSECGCINDVSEDNILCVDDYSRSSEDDILNTPIGCRACGGEYPYCKTSCPLFDD